MHVPVAATKPPLPHTVLVVEDDPLIMRVLCNMLELEGFTTVVAESGEAAVEYALRDVPHLVLLDLMLPCMDGFEVTRRLRANVKTAHIPVLMISARHDTADKVRAFESRVDDYLTKPFNTEELLARIRTQLRHVQQNLLSPLTGLPSGLQVERAINQTLRESGLWAILYIDLDHFKAYNDVYGFLRGNDLIRLMGQTASETVRALGNPTDVVGHIGGDDFVVITTPERIEPICEELIQRFDAASRAYYPEEDLRRGFLVAHDRQGIQRTFPLISLSIGVVTTQHRPVTTAEEISQIAAEVKRKAKEIGGSAYFVDRRHEGISDLNVPHGAHANDGAASRIVG